MLKNSLLKIPQKPMIGMKGEYRFVVRDARTGNIKRETDWFSNLITDAGLNRLGTGGWRHSCHIGTGTNAPANGDTSLAAQAAVATNAAIQWTSVSNSGSPNYHTTTTVVWRFGAGQLNGNYTEVGISWSGTTLFSRALIVDGGGSPTSITVTSSEFLDVYYRLSMVPDLTDHIYSVTIQGVTYNVTRRASAVSQTTDWEPYDGEWVAGSRVGGGVRAYSGTLGPVTGAPGGAQLASYVNATQATYSNNSFTRTSSASYGLNELNVGGIKTLVVYNYSGTWQHEFDTAIPKDNTKIMTLSFSLTWGRV